MKMIKGRMYLLGNSISTDMIFPPKAIEAQDGSKLAELAFSELNKSQSGKIKDGDIIVAGTHFGVCYQAHSQVYLEKAIDCLKELGIRCIIAGSFSRLFYRCAINGGITLLESKDACKLISLGEEIEVDPTRGLITHKAGQIKAIALPETVIRILDAGGLIPYVKKLIG